MSSVVPPSSTPSNAFLEEACDDFADLILYGDAGIGKTALWARALERPKGLGIAARRLAGLGGEARVTAVDT
jgi:hypothetical protein